MARRWKPEQFLEFAQGGVVVALDRAARPVRLPDPLATWPTPEPDERGWVNMLSLVHRAHRGRVARAWWQSQESPNGAASCEVIACLPGENHARLQQIRFVNLLDDPGAEAILVAVVDLGETDELQKVSSPLSDTFQAPAWAISFINGVGTTLRVDGMAEVLYGRSCEELVGGNVMQTVHPEAQDVALDMWLEVLGAPGLTRTFQHRVLRPDGTSIWIESTVMNRTEPQGPASVVIVSHDVEARRRQITALEESQEQFRMLAEDVPAGVFRADRNGRIEFGNARWHQLVGHAEVTRLDEVVHRDDRREFSDAWSALFGRQRHPSTVPEARVIEFRSVDGERVLSLSCRVTGAGPGEHGTVIGAMHDVTATTELRYRADHDPLTGLLNRRAFDRRMDDLLSRRQELAGDPLEASSLWALFFVDLDGFKGVNDEFGHDVGDLVLQTIGHRLRSELRPGDFVARYGGDEFVVLAQEVPLGEEQAVADRIQRALSTPIRWPGGDWVPRASIGMARAALDDTPDALLKRADEAMYDDKRRRR